MREDGTDTPYKRTTLSDREVGVLHRARLGEKLSQGDKDVIHDLLFRITPKNSCWCGDSCTCGG